MRVIAILFCIVVAFAESSPAPASEAEVVAAVNNAADALDEAFEKQDAAKIKELMAQDHLAVTPYYDGPQSVAEQIASLRDLKYTQTNLGKVRVELLGADAALRTFNAQLKGTFKGKPIPRRVYVTEVFVKDKGSWVEKFYQVTALPGAKGPKAAPCKELMGTYLTKNAAKGASEVASRSLLSFGSGGIVSFADSGEGGESGFAPFTEGSGTWRCMAGANGDAKVKATTFDFTEPAGGVKGEIGRLDFDLAYDAGKRTLKGGAVLNLLPLSDDPLKPGKPAGGRAFEIVAQRIPAPQ
jgi:ketosteroid isomerase-like protein